MTILTWRVRRLSVAAAGLAAAFTLAVPVTAAQAATTDYAPNASQWYFGNWHVQQDVWPVSEGSGVTVAVVDSGVEASNPDLQGVVEPGTDLINSGNGETDHEASSGGHGTEVASLIAGQGTGGPAGIAPQAKILPVRADGNMSVVASGIKYAAAHGAQVINVSLGINAPSSTSCDPQLQSAVDYALDQNVVVVAASGDTNKNGTTPQEPATCAGVIAVGAAEPDGSLWQGSTQGPYVSVAAPGDHIYVTSADGQQTSYNSSGTSYSAPLVAGAAALVKSANPSMPWYTIVQRLIDTALPVGSVPNDGTGYGIIRPNRAVNVSQYPVNSSAPNPVYQAYLKSTGQSGKGAGVQPTSGKSGSGSAVAVVVAIVAVLIVIGAVIAGVLIVRRRSRKGPRNPGGPPPGYGPPGGYPPGQYPPPGQPQYPPPGGYQR